MPKPSKSQQAMVGRKSHDETAPFRETLLRFPAYKDNEAGEDILAMRAESDPDKRERMLNLICARNLRLVNKVAWRYMYLTENCNLTMADLCQEGSIGLLKAIEKYDPDRGLSFAGHALWWIRAYITRHLSRNEAYGLPRLSQHYVEMRRNIGKARQELAIRLGRQPEDHEVYALFQAQGEKVISLNAFGTILRHMRQVGQPLDTPLNDEVGSATLHDIIPGHELDPETILEVRDQQRVFRGVIELAKAELEKLPKRTRDVVHLRLGPPGTIPSLQEIADSFNLSRERIRQLELIASKRLLATIGISLTDLIDLIDADRFMDELLIR